MNKSTLNTEILNCKPTVKKAKVHTVRNIRKKIGILKRCKKENQKEKKQKKAERLIQEIMTIKKLHFSEVMRFALRTTTVEDVLKTPANEKEHACAVLAKHHVIKDKVNAIRKKFNNRQEDLLPLLDLFNKKCKKKKVLNNVKEETKTNNAAHVTEEQLPTVIKGTVEVVSVKKKKLKSRKKKTKDTKNKNATNDSKVKEKNFSNKKVNCNSPDSSSSHDEKIANENNKSQKNFNATENKVNKKMKSKTNKLEKKQKILGKAESKLNEKLKPQLNKLEKKPEPEKLETPSSKDVSDNGFSKSDNENDQDKVVDPFFVNKKILKPKIIEDDDRSSEPEFDNSEVVENKFKRNPKNSLWNVKNQEAESNKFLRQKPEKQKRVNTRSKRTLPEEELHPSWAAKKSVKPIIQPFQGKKIKFNND